MKVNKVVIGWLSNDSLGLHKCYMYVSLQDKKKIEIEPSEWGALSYTFVEGL